MYLEDSAYSALKSMASLCEIIRDGYVMMREMGKEEEVELYLNARKSHVGPYRV